MVMFGGSMLKYSGSYANTEKNFVILNMNNEQRIKDDNLYSLLCVVQNIIQRGHISRPSNYLMESLGSIGDVDKPCFLWPTEDSKWTVIKGDDENADYPADIFYEHILGEFFGEYAFIKNLTIPEAHFEDLLEDTKSFNGQQVDFYIPQIRTVIEIDGSSHLDQEQKSLDQQRDEILAKNNIEVYRFAAGDVRNIGSGLNELMKPLIEKRSNSEILKEYISNKTIDGSNVRVKYDAVYRIQMFLLQCFKNGILNLNNKIYINIINSDVSDIENLVKFAYQDVCLWIKNIAQILKAKIEIPDLILGKNESNSIDVDISMFARYTDTTVVLPKAVYIRTGYYYDKDYYSVATAETLQYNFLVEQEENDDKALRFLVKNIFGFDDFNEGQMPIIKNVLEKKDTIGILPTGGGKSLTYQFCALLQPGVTLVVVPIVSLMQDQKRGLDLKGINRTSFISSSQTGEEKGNIIDEMKAGKYQIVWISPERFQNKDFRHVLESINRSKHFALAVLDEVHCLSEWGHDFRVSYLALIPTIVKYCPEAILMGLTATASQAVLEDLKVEFGIDGTGIKALTSMDRPELHYKRIKVYTEDDRKKAILKIVNEQHEDYTNKNGETKHKIGLIFCPTVKTKIIKSYDPFEPDRYRTYSACDAIKSSLILNGYDGKFSSYHGQMTMADRTAVQEKFMDNKFDLMICTKAFGMGIDKDNIKWTIHAALPQSVESFYQEAGRAGREKDKSVASNCYIIYMPEEESSIEDVNNIFKADTTIEKRIELSQKLHNDISTIMYFWNGNKEPVELEYAGISAVLRKLYEGKSTLNFGIGKDAMYLNDIQKSLYKLFLLGIVENWTIKYQTLDSGYVYVDYKGLDEGDIKLHLYKYIHKYDKEFSIEQDSKRYHKYYSMNNTDELPITKLIKVLIEWGNDNVIYNRLQSTYTMLQWLDSSVSDVQFRRNIIEYFKFSELTVILDGVVQDPLDYNIWFDALYAKDTITNQRISVIDTDLARTTLVSLQRYLESYRNNTGLNYLCGMLRLLAGNYIGTEGEWRFKESLQNIKESLSEQEILDIVSNTILVGNNMDLPEKDKLSEMIIGNLGGFEKLLFDGLHDRFSLGLLLQEPTAKLNHIMEGIK